MTRISRDMTIVGVPALEIRKLFRDGDRFIAAQAERLLGVPAKRAEEIMHALVREGFLKRDESFRQADGDVVWELTTQGRALRIAKACKPIKRSTADKLVAEFLARVEEANRRSYYAYRVERVVVFGSYLSDRPDLGDIDLGLEFEAKWPEEGTYESLTRPRIRAALKAGRSFKSFVDETSWPQIEIQLFLKNRSRALSLTYASMIPAEATTKILYQWKRQK